MTAPIADLATTENLLVVADFDGTLAGITTDPYNVPVNLDSLAALTRLAGLPATTVAVLSGRHLNGLAQVCKLTDPVITVGSHGAESSSHGISLSEEQQTALEHIEQQLRVVLSPYPRTFVETKPLQRVAHVAALAAEDPSLAAEVLERAAAIDHPGATRSFGKNIVEFSVATANKGTWLSAEKQRLAATATIFIGDDTTDEDGFRVLGDADLGVKVGEGDTAATHRVADLNEVAAFLQSLAAERAAHVGIPKPVPERFTAIAAGMSAEVIRVRDWDAQTPCEKWLARDIITHLCTWYPENLRHAGIDLDLREDPAADPAAAWVELAAKVRELLADPARSETRFNSGPDQGYQVAEATAWFFLPDVFMHTWDLARSQGNTVELDPDYAERNLRGLKKVGAALQDGGQFGPPRQVAESASPGTRLMAYVGRDPEFGR